MREMTQLKMPDGQTIWADIDVSQPADVAWTAVPRALEGLLETLRGVAGNIRDGLTEARPDEVSVEFGVGIGLAGQSVVAALTGIDGNADIRVTLKWTNAVPGPVDD